MKVMVTKDDTTIVEERGGKEEDVKAASSRSKAEIDKTDSDYDREKLQSA